MVWTYLIAHISTIVVMVAWLVMLSRGSRSPRNPQSTLAWLLAIALIPFVAIPLYIALGRRKFPASAKGQQLAIPPVRDGHAFELHTTGESAFAALIALIESAKQSIDLTVFILGRDATGRAVVEALVARAKAGVAVRVILDAVGSLHMHREAAAALSEVGGEVRVFMPLRHSPIRGRSNLRSHRKIVIVDELSVFAGGMNFANEYMGTAETAGPTPRWRDVVAVVRGPVVADAITLFDSDWAYCGGKARVRSPARTEPAGGARAQFVPSGPDMTTDTVYDLFLTRIFEARERVVIVTPYYVPDDALQHAVVLCARRGVRTELLIPAWSNHRVADLARRPPVRELRANGVVVHYYTRGMVHAKAMVVDDAFAYVGSPNFDMRSLLLNYEDAVCVYSSDAIAQIRTFIDGLIAECSAEAPAFPQQTFIEDLARFLAPEL